MLLKSSNLCCVVFCYNYALCFLLKYKCMEEKDKLIASLRQQLRKVLRENSAQKQEIALLNHELERAKMKPSK